MRRVDSDGIVGISLREQAKHSAEMVNLSAPPPGMRSVFTVQGNQAVFKLSQPCNRWLLRIFVPLLSMILLYFVYLYCQIFNDSQMPMPSQIKWKFGLLIGTQLLHLLGFILHLMYGKITVSADPNSLRLATKNVLLRNTKEIASADLEELRLVKHFGLYNLTARSRKKILRFGYGLSREELEWIRTVLLKALTI
jgi:hypothetical protein